MNFLRLLSIFASLSALVSCTADTPPVKTSPPDYILAFSWQPAFCETKPSKPECRSQTPSRFDATRFALHGLWPQPRNQNYCEVDPKTVETDKIGRWMQLEKLQLDKETRNELQMVMPGYQSGLHRHEWIKHGTCYQNSNPQKYYEDSLWLMRQLNHSGLAKLFARNISASLTREQIRAEFDNSFGIGAGDRLRVKCVTDQNSDRRLIVEITLALKGKISTDANFSDLVLAANPDDKQGCPGGIVDATGLQ